MSVNRVLRYLGGLIIASVLLFLILPFVGVAQSKFLPPPLVYAKADGRAVGRITGKSVSPTANPFKTGDHVYLVDYKFVAPTPQGGPPVKGSPKQAYTGTLRAPDEGAYNAAQIGAYIKPIKYEKTYPEINGIDTENGGRSVGAGSNILSGWLLFVLLDLILAYGIMALVLERFGRAEDI